MFCLPVPAAAPRDRLPGLILLLCSRFLQRSLSCEAETVPACSRRAEWAGCGSGSQPASVPVQQVGHLQGEEGKVKDSEQGTYREVPEAGEPSWVVKTW